MNIKLLRYPQVIERVGLKRASIYRLMNLQPPQFPKPISIGPKAVAWISTEIDAWIAERIANGRLNGDRSKITEKATAALSANRRKRRESQAYKDGVDLANEMLETIKEMNLKANDEP